MRIVIDMQAVQAGRPGSGAALQLVRELLRQSAPHTCWLLVNGARADAIDAIRSACAGLIARERIVVFDAPVHPGPDPLRAARLIREHTLAMLAPDRVLLLGVFDDSEGPWATSTGLLGAGPATALVCAPTDAAPTSTLTVWDTVLAPADGAALLAALAQWQPAQATPAPMPLSLVVARAAAPVDALFAQRRIAPDAGIDAVRAAAGNGAILYYHDCPADTEAMLALLTALPGALLLATMDARPAPAAARFAAHGYPGLLAPAAPANLALLQAAQAVLYIDPALRAAAGACYGADAVLDWLPAADAPALSAALSTWRQRAGSDHAALAQALAAIPGAPLAQLAYCMAQAPDARVPRQLLVDVTAIVQHDLKTGIERVVRAQLLDLLQRGDSSLRVEPVYLSDAGGRWHYRYARRYALALLGLAPDTLAGAPEALDSVADVRGGDLFYCADYSPRALVCAAQSGLYAYWRARGVALHFVVYDLLPVRQPQFFPSHSGDAHAAWLEAVARHGDKLLCISGAVADDMRAWLAERQIAGPQVLALHLGADLDENGAAPAARDDAVLPAAMTAAPAFLMVGTIEPRKGHLQAIAAFEALWAAGVDAHLVIIGHEGWRGLPDAERRTIPRIVARLQHHPELNKRLFWLQGPSDAVLRRAYAECACLLVASEGEGFGLPLIEAARLGLPVLARGLQVFREVAGSHASYFDGLEAADLAGAVRAWLDAAARGQGVPSHAMPWQTWHANVDALLAILQDAGGATAAPGSAGI